MTLTEGTLQFTFTNAIGGRKFENGAVTFRLEDGRMLDLASGGP